MKMSFKYIFKTVSSHIIFLENLVDCSIILILYTADIAGHNEY